MTYQIHRYLLTLGFCIFHPTSVVQGKDVISSDRNVAYERITAKSRASHGERNGKCAEFIEIRSQRDWDKFSDQLDTVIDSKSKCKDLTVYKVIKNVYKGRLPKNNSRANVGTRIKRAAKLRDVNIDVITIIENSTISTGVLSSGVNAGLEIEDSAELNNVDISAEQEIKNSRVGGW